ncbi:MAG: hypothetical protein JWM88_2967 [Verrucomicrobia bacterium]|nr:hypothetical protein [Verrucomicrobiota bacterium]
MNPPPPDAGEGTGLPGLRRWRSVYVAVLVIFAGWIALLTLLTRCYS